MDTKVVDFHCHLGRWGYPRMDDDPDRYVRIMDAAGVDVGCVNCIFYGDARRGNDIVARFVASRPERFVGVAFATPHYPEEAVRELERAFGELGMKFLKIYPNYAGRPNDDPAYYPIYEWCSDRGTVVMTHAREAFERRDRRLQAKYEALSERFPGVTWVLAHAGSGGANYLHEAVEAARAVPSVYLETASSDVAHGAFEYVVESVGADRVLYGSDMPLFDARNEVARIATADLPEESKRKILGLNAIRLLGLRL